MKKSLPVLFALALLWSCSNKDYDISKGIDNEYTLFSDEISAPVGDVGPLSLGILLDGTGFRETIDSYVREDEDGFLVIEKEDQLYTNFVMLLSMMTLDPSQPSDFAVDDITKSIESMAAALGSLGVSLSGQTFNLYATNPLTDGISVSGHLTLKSDVNGENPATVIASEDFSKVPVAAEADKATVLQVVRPNEKAFYGCELKNLTLHLPASVMEKDPSAGMGVVSLGYGYKSFLSLGDAFSLPFSYTIDDLDLKLGQYKVKETTIRTDVYNEIPLTLAVDSVEVVVGDVVYDDVSITPGLVIASGSKAHPTISPLEIVIEAREGTTLPDISALKFNFTVGPPTGEGDTRIGLNQNVYFNNIRATVTGGITVQGL